MALGVYAPPLQYKLSSSGGSKAYIRHGANYTKSASYAGMYAMERFSTIGKESTYFDLVYIGVAFVISL